VGKRATTKLVIEDSAKAPDILRFFKTCLVIALTAATLTPAAVIHCDEKPSVVALAEEYGAYSVQKIRTGKTATCGVCGSSLEHILYVHSQF
jgi:hypothetical protein